MLKNKTNRSRMTYENVLKINFFLCDMLKELMKH